MNSKFSRKYDWTRVSTMHEGGPVVCDYIKIGQNGKPKRESSDSSLGFLGDSFSSNRTRGFVQAKNKKVTSVPVDIGWLA